MTSKQTFLTTLAAALALSTGIATFSVASARNAAHAAAPTVQKGATPDNDVETNDDGPQSKSKAKSVSRTTGPLGDGDGETNDDGPRAGAVRR